MNNTETRAYDWLLSQGCSQSDITFQRHKSPDFITTDHKGYEVKLLTKTNRVWFHNNQLNDLINTKNVYLLVFGKENKEPLLIKLTTELFDGASINNIKICSAGNVSKSVILPESDSEYVHWLIEKGKFAGVSDIVRAAIRLLQEQRKEKDIEFYKKEQTKGELK